MKYEFMGIIKPFLPEDVRIKLVQDIRAAIEKRGGTITSEDVWGKRHLSYVIKGHEEGYYLLYELELNPDKLEEINEEFRLMGDLLRFMFVKN